MVDAARNRAQRAQKSRPLARTKPVARRSRTSERVELHAWSRHRSQSMRTPDALARTDTGPSLPLADADQPPVAPRSDRDAARPATPSGRAHRSAATATAVHARRGPAGGPGARRSGALA